MTDQEPKSKYEDLQHRLHHSLGWSPWLTFGSPGSTGDSWALPWSLGASLPLLGWDWAWGRAWRWGLSYVPLALLGIGLWAAPLVARQSVITPPVAERAVSQVAVVEGIAGVEVLEPVRRSAEVRMDAGWAAMRKERPARETPPDAQEQAAAGVVLAAQPVHATLSEKPAIPNPKVRKRQDRPGPNAEIADGVFTDEQVMGLVDDWLIPLLVDSLVRERLTESREGQAP